MNVYKKLLLVTSLSFVPVILIGMEQKEKALRRIKKSGYISCLVEHVDVDMTLDNYRIDRMRTDLVSSRNDLYSGLALEILAGCNTGELFKNDTDIDFIELCAALIPLLESRHANKIDKSRVKRFLKKAIANRRINIEDVETIEVPNSHVPLQRTVFYELVDRLCESDPESDQAPEYQMGEHVDAQPMPLPALSEESIEQLVMVPPNIHQDPSLGREQRVGTTRTGTRLSRYKTVISVVVIAGAVAIASKWYDSKQRKKADLADEVVAQEE